MTVMPAAAPTIAPLLAPDLAAVKQRQQATWSSGDYHMIGTQIQVVSELMIEALDVHSNERVLDVATGSGNAALAAARRGCDVIGVDYVPSLLARARRRADAEGLPAEFVEGDAEALPFRDGRFDVVSSVFGAMFAPDQERTASELVRVCRAGGRIGLVAHTPDGFIGQLFKVVAAPCPAAGGRALADPVGHRGAPARAVRGRRSAGCAPRSGCTSSAIARRRCTSTTGGGSTARRSRRSRRSARTGERRSSRTCCS